MTMKLDQPSKSTCCAHSCWHSPIGIQEERNIFHVTIGEALLERYTELLKTCTRLPDVIDRDSDMSKAPARVRVTARIPLKVGIGLGPVVVRELQNA